MTRRERQRKQRQSWRRRGLCTRCGKPAPPARARCKACNARTCAQPSYGGHTRPHPRTSEIAKLTAKRREWRAAGLCDRCGKKRVLKRRTCAHCSRVATRNTLAWQQRNAADGVCRFCRRPIHHSMRCAAHFAKYIIANTRRRLRKQLGVYARTCTICGYMGHTPVLCRHLTDALRALIETMVLANLVNTRIWRKEEELRMVLEQEQLRQEREALDDAQPWMFRFTRDDGTFFDAPFE